MTSLLNTIQEQFPAPDEDEAADDLDMAFGPSEGKSSSDGNSAMPTTLAERQKAAEKGIQSIAKSLKYEVKRFGARVRNPSVVADRWNLLIDLQEFRGKCRAAIGELVHSSVNAFVEVGRPVVVPEYAADLAEGLAARQRGSR